MVFLESQEFSALNLSRLTRCLNFETKTFGRHWAFLKLTVLRGIESMLTQSRRDAEFLTEAIMEAASQRQSESSDPILWAPLHCV